MSKNKISKIWASVFQYAQWAPVMFCLFIAALITYLLLSYTQSLLRERLNERMNAIASTSALHFDGDEIAELKSQGINSIKTKIYTENLFKLQQIRNANSDIKYVYILGQTDDPNQVVFIVDADASNIEPVIDFNEDGVIDEEDVSAPGEIYDATEVPALQKEAFERTAVDDELTIDEWGTFLSAYSPIYDSSNKVVGTLTIDVEVTDYLRIIKATFLPFILFIIVLCLLITSLTIVITRIWKSRVEIVKELDRQKDELLSIVSHQLATPTTAIRWQMEMMLDGDLGKLTKEQKEHIESTHKVTANLVDLIQMILDVSRIQLGKMQVSKQELDLNEFFKDLINVIQPKALEKKTNFKVSIPKNLPVAMLDKRLTNMTLENLLSNAVKYTPSGGDVEFTVTLEGNMVKCVVRDTGVGIPEKDQSQIFGKLYRATNVRNTVDGNGFGLYVAKGAVEGQGGSIRFESKEGKGTTFYVELPIK